jgi:hypothetical protein
VTIAPDALAEPNETLLVTLSNLGGGGTPGSPSTATLYILDDELRTVRRRAEPGV